MTRLLSRAFIIWLPLAVLLTGLFAFCFVAVQQNYRQLGNDPQIQLAEDAAFNLSQGAVPASLVTRGVPPIDLTKSLSTWLAIYDSSGTPLESSAELDGAPPRMPEGLLDPRTWVAHKTWQAPSGPETRVSWQPRANVRQAVTIVQFTDARGVGYVAVGRSMRSTEERIIGLAYTAAVTWALTALATYFAIFIILALGWL